MSAPRRTSRPSGCLARGLKIFGGGVLAIFLVFHLLNFNPRSVGLPIGSWPGNPWYIYTTSRITLTFDGQSVELEGTTLCKRNLAFESDGGSAFYTVFPTVRVNLYHCGPEWFATRLEDGSALLVGAHSRKTPAPRTPEGARRSGLSFDPEQRAQAIARIPPAVIWVDDAEAPTKAEYYYSAAALEDPRSRLSDLEIEVSIQPASFLTSLAVWRMPSRPAEVVPGLAQPWPGELLTGLYVSTTPETTWREIDGYEDLLGNNRTAKRFASPSDFPDKIRGSLGRFMATSSPGFLQSFMWTNSDTPIFYWGSRDSGEYYEASISVSTLSIQENGLIFVPEHLPVGMILLDRRLTNKIQNELHIVIDGITFEGTGRRFLFDGDFIFSAENGEFYRYQDFRISDTMLSK